MQLLFTKPYEKKKFKSLYQWDTGVHAEFNLDGLDPEDNVEMVFSAYGTDDGIRKHCTYDTDQSLWSCKVPDSVLTYGQNVRAYVRFVGEDLHAQTIAESIFNVIKSAKPAGYVSDDSDEFISFEQLMEIVNQAKKETLDAKEYVDKKIEKFNEDSEVISEKAKETIAAAEQAKKSEENALQYKKDAESAKNAAIDAKTKTETAKNEAVAAKETAETVLKTAVSTIGSATEESKQDIKNKTEEQIARIPDVIQLLGDVTDINMILAKLENAEDGTITSRLSESINKKYTKPETGIPLSDLAAGVIPEPTTDEHINNLIDEKLTPLEALSAEILGVM